MGLRTVIFALLLGTSACAAAAPSEEYSGRIWRSEDGLPQNKVQAISQTPEGYLWIGSSGGLVRFDGVRFVVFDRSNTPALSDESILSLCPTRDGSLWIGTEGGGLVHMADGKFQAFGAAQGLSNGFVRTLLEDRQGRLWVGTDRGFFRLDGDRFVRFDGRAEAPILATRSIFQDDAGMIWIGTSFGLFHMDGDRMIADHTPRSRVNDPAAGDVTSIVESRPAGLWLASETGLQRVIDGKPAPKQPLIGVHARTLYRDREGNLWIGTAGTGLTRMSGDGALTQFTAADMLPDNTISAVFEGREHNIWVGTQDGLLRLSRSAVYTVGGEDGLPDDSVTTVYEDPRGTLWMGTATAGLYRFEGGRAVPFHPPAPFGQFRARNIYVDREGVEWLGSTVHGVLRIERGHARVFNMSEGLRSNGIRQVLEDRRGIVWIASGSGLSRWDGKSMRTYYLEEGLAYGGVRVLAEARNGDLLVGTDGGMNRVHEDRFVPDAAFTKLGNERVWTIFEDPDGSLWLGTRGNGIARIRNGKVTRFTTRDGLLSNAIYQILDDGHDRLWMSGSAGIFSADRRELDAVADGRAGPVAVVPYGTDDGMRSSQMNGGAQSAGCRTRTGEFWFPSVKGAVRIEPRGFTITSSAPVLIESVFSGDLPLPLTGKLSIPPGRGKLEIDFTSPTLRSPERVTFKYKLEGFDEAWTPSPHNRAAWYTNLPPGKYRFHVIARDGARPASTTEAVLPFEIQPLFYQTVWFYCALALLAALAIWSVLRLYARQTRDRYALVLAERTRLAREMHDTVIQGCVGVSTLLEAARSLPPSGSGKVRELMDRAASQIRLTVNEAREAVWDLRHSALEQGLEGTLQSFAEQISAAEGIPVRADIQGTPAPLEEAAGRNLLLVAREAIRNAVIHAHPRKIDVVLCFDAAHVRLEIRDDGLGFSPATPRENAHYGIVGMRERVQQSGGAFDLQSSPGKGTQVTVTLPLGKGN